jgi:hypothetical protein
VSYSFYLSSWTGTYHNRLCTYLVEGTVVCCELLLLLPLRHHLARPHVRCATIIKWSTHSVRCGRS